MQINIYLFQRFLDMSYNPVNKRVIYVGGLAENVDEKILHAAFIPFGDIVQCNMPMDFETEQNRGFGFVEYEHMDDANAAVDNLDDSEMFGRTVFFNKKVAFLFWFWTYLGF